MTRAKIQPSGLHAVFAMDPGGTTGVMSGLVELKSTLRASLATIDRKQLAEVTGSYVAQGEKLRSLWGEWILDCLRFEVEANHRHIAIEDFVLRMPSTTTNLTSIWVAAYFHGLIKGDGGCDLAFQQPSAAKSFARNDRLKLWGLYVKGSEHKRDATRHFALKVNYLLG